MKMAEYVTAKNAEGAERQIAEAFIDAGMVGQEVDLIAAIRADERAHPFAQEHIVAAREAYKRRMRSNPTSWQSYDNREEDAILAALEAAQAARTLPGDPEEAMVIFTVEELLAYAEWAKTMNDEDVNDCVLRLSARAGVRMERAARELRRANRKVN